MPRLVTKFKYLKPSTRMKAGGYAKYIATREGAEKIDESQKHLPDTEKQKKLIRRILRDFPDSKGSHEYADYLRNKSSGNASEFISRSLEEHADEALEAKTYADYIATRPRAERFGSHGLFTDDGVPVQLSKVSKELNEHAGNVWTSIISIRREDAARLGYDHGERWRDMLRSQTQNFSDAFHTHFEGQLRHICEVCGRTEILTPQEAFDQGWDYPPMMGSFGIISPRTCPNCSIMDTVWAALTLHGKNVDELNSRQKQTIERIVSEPGSILV